MDRSLSGSTFRFEDPDGRLADPHRLRRLRETGLIDIRGDPTLDHLTGQAAQITGEGTAVMCLVEATRQTFPSAHGLSSPLEADREVPLSHSLSQYVVTNDAPMVISDAREHPVLRHNLAVAVHGVVAYAGYPLHGPDGVVLGSLCLGESAPRVWSVEQLGMLSDLAVRIETEIALRWWTRHAQLCQQRMQYVERTVDTAVLSADTNGVVTAMNDGAEKILAVRAASVIGIQSLSHVLRTSQPLGPEPGEGQARDWLMVDGAGRTKVVSIRSGVLRDSFGRLDGYMLVADDVSGRSETETLMREAVHQQRQVVERLTELDRARNVFIATASHELRTPLASILGYTELLVEGAAGALSPAQLDLLNRVDRNSQRLFALVEELIDLSRLDSRTSTVVRASMDANAPAEHAWEALQPHLVGRELQAHLEICPAAPQIVGDAAQVERALLKLLQNAVKFTPDGGTLQLTVRTTSHGVEYEVADTGIGIAEAEQASVFDPFFRTQQAHSLAIPGAGLGLSIVQRIVEAHHGRVRVTSRTGSGTTVLVALPTTRQATPSGSRHGVLATEELPEPAALHRSLESELRLALEGTVTQLVLHYQPVVDLTSGKVVEVEALVRWQHPVRGLLAPDQFIPLAEATGLVHRLGNWALDQAVRDAANLTHEGRELDIAVNFSVRQPDGQAVATAKRSLESGGLRPGRLILEVTESAFVEDEGVAAASYEALSQLGVRIAVDDFGTGSSSLLHLRRNPIKALKIARKFIAGIGESADDEAICESIISLAGAVGASTTGKGVETTAQYAVLRSLGCRRGQGFLWSAPVPIEELDSALAACVEVPKPAPRSRMSRAPGRVPSDVTATIASMQAEGASMHTIAAALNRTVGRHPNGVRWTAGAVARALPAEGGPPTGRVANAPNRSWSHG